MTKPTQSVPAISPGQVFLLAAWFGLASGLVEGLEYWGLARLGWLSLNEALLDVGPQQVWISAVFNLALFTALAVPLAVGKWMVRSLRWPAIVLFIFLFASFFGLLALPDRIRLRGASVLALGIAVQCVRWLSRKTEYAIPSFRSSFPAVGALVIAAFVVTSGGARLLEWISIRSLPHPASGAPNVLLIVLDTLRADHLSCSGYPRATTPNLDRLATEGVLFERAYSTSSWTLPSHASLFTGRYTYEHRADGRITGRMLDAKYPTVAEAFRARGYATAAFVSNVAWGSPRTGLGRGFQHYENLYTGVDDSVSRTFYGRFLRRYLNRYVMRISRSPGRASHEIIAEFLGWRSRTAGNRPYFAFLNLMDAHDPAFSLPPQKGKFQGAAPLQGGQNAAELWKLRPQQTRDREELLGEYDSALAYMDAQLGKLFDELKARGEWNHTLIVVTSDHGELFGEYGLFDHGNGAHHAVIHVPLLIRYGDKVPAGGRMSAAVTQADLPATMLHLANPGVEQHMGGTTLSRLWDEQLTGGDEQAVFSETDKADIPAIPAEWPARKGWVKTVISGTWQLILREDGQLELYNLRNDPLATRNLASAAEHRTHLERLLAVLSSRIPESAPAVQKAMQGLK